MKINIPTRTDMANMLLSQPMNESSKVQTEKKPSEVNMLFENYYTQNKTLESSKLNADKVKTIFLGECLDNLFEASLDISVPKEVRMNFINSFIKEQGINKLMKEFKLKNYVLSEMVFYIEKQTKTVLEACKDLDTNQIQIKATEQVPELIANLDDFESKKVSEKIADRVAKAVSDFIQTNKSNGEAIKDVMTKAQEKVDQTVNEGRIRSIEKDMGKTIYDIRHNGNKSILEYMVNYMSKQTLAIMENKADFNINDAINKAKIMYTFLEMQNTLSMKKIDKPLIESMLIKLK